MLKNAVNLVTALQDTERRCKLQHILTDFRNTMQAMEVDKIDLENQLDEELHNIQEQRGALDRKEQEARLSMVQRDPESTARISSLFETSISNLTSMDEFSATSTEQDNARSSELGEVCDEAVAGGTPDKHSGGGIYHTIDEACCENTDSKPGKHGDSDPSALQDIPDDHDADENHIGTMDAGCEDSDSKPSD